MLGKPYSRDRGLLAWSFLVWASLRRTWASLAPAPAEDAAPPMASTGRAGQTATGGDDVARAGRERADARLLPGTNSAEKVAEGSPGTAGAVQVGDLPLGQRPLCGKHRNA